MSQELFIDHGLGITNPRHKWRAFDGLGEINGLPASRGFAFATDGVLVQIRRDDGSVFEGHLDYFVKEKQARSVSSQPKTKTKTRRNVGNLEDYE